MTPEEINRLIAEKCMGWKLDKVGYWNPSLINEQDFDPYHNISHAMMALEKFEIWSIRKRADRIEKEVSYQCMIRATTTVYSDWYVMLSLAISLAIVEAMKGE